MHVLSTKLTFYIPHDASLKDKRQVCRSLIGKTRQKFNVSIAEVDTQDVHQTLTIGVAVVSGDVAHTRWSKIVQNKALHNAVTIRNANTTKKLAELTEQRT